MLIAVAGAGIGGLTLAAGLAATGIDIAVFERQDSIRAAGAGISLWPNAFGALDSIGLGDTVRSLAPGLGSFRQVKRNGQAGLRVDAVAFRRALGHDLVCVDRGELVGRLAELLPVGSVHPARTVTGYRRDDQKVQIRFAEGDPVEADALVAADGTSSAIASQLGGPLERSYSGYTAWRGIAPVEVPQHVSACLSGGHEFGWIPVGGGRTYWFATATAPEQHHFAQGDASFLSATFGAWPDPVPRLVGATAPEALLRNDIVDRASPRVWTDGPVTVLGDAAHPMRPHLGQGGCQAIEDAAVLIDCLRRGQQPAAAFQRYQRLRIRRAARIVKRSRTARLTFAPGLFGSAAGRAVNLVPRLNIPFGALKALAPIAGYSSGSPPTD